jgi:Protein of unknown function (DUF2004)
MSEMTHPVLGQVEVDDVAGPSWRAGVVLAGYPVELSFDPGDAPLDAGQLDVLTGVAERLAELDRSARAAMLRDWVEDLDSEGAGSYLIHHVEEVSEAGVAEALGIPAPLDAERFVAALRLVHVGVGPDEPMVLDYTINRDFTNYVLAVSIDADGEVSSINTES